MQQIITNNNTRLFINDINSCYLNGKNSFRYMGCVIVESVTQGKGAATRLKCPDPLKYDSFITYKTVSGPLEDGQISTSQYLQYNQGTFFKDIFDNNKSIDMQVRMGNCGSIYDSNNYRKALIIYNANITSLDLPDISILSSNNTDVIHVESDFTFDKFIELYETDITSVSNSMLALGPIIGCKTLADMDCSTCLPKNADYFVQLRYDSGTTNGTAWIIYTPDKGITWHEYDVLASLPLNNADQILRASSLRDSTDTNIYSIILDNFIQYNNSNDINTILANTVKVTPALELNPTPALTFMYFNHTYGNLVWSGGAGPNYLTIQDGINGTRTNLPNNTSLTSSWQSVDDLDGDLWIAGGTNGMFLHGSLSSGTSTEITIPDRNGVPISTNFGNIAYIDKNTWLVSTQFGDIRRTADAGKTWHNVALPSGCIAAMEFYDKYIGYIVFAPISVNGIQIFRTIDGGLTWKQLTKNGVPYNFPPAADLTCISISENNPNKLIVSGRLTTTPLSPEDHCNPSVKWNVGTDKGLVVFIE